MTPTTLKREAATTNIELHKWLDDRKNRRALPHKLERAGYSAVRNLEAEDGLWLVAGKRESMYVRSDIKGDERLPQCIACKTQSRSGRIILPDGPCDGGRGSDISHISDCPLLPPSPFPLFNSYKLE